jgi:hypothetical protein
MWCHNYSPYSPEREFSSDEYFDSLDLLTKNGVLFDLLSIMGGEPFLHSNLDKFCFDVAIRYRRPLYITTNGFWLSRENIRLYKELWPLIYRIKFSRYPSIEKRLGGEKNIQELFNELKQYNPKMTIDWPQKYTFNKLLFFDEPKPPELYCGNVACLALLTDGRIGHCGAGAYQHLAPKGSLSQAFLDSKEMFYDLKKFDLASFHLWHKRYPLDACFFCNFSQKNRSVTWKPVKGQGLFRKEYEYVFERNQCLRLEAAGNSDAVNKRIVSFLTKEPAAAEELCKVAVCRAPRDIRSAVGLLEDIVNVVPQNEATLQLLKSFAKRIRPKITDFRGNK